MGKRYILIHRHCQEIVVTLQTGMATQFPHALRSSIEDAAQQNGRAASIMSAAAQMSDRYRRVEGKGNNHHFQLKSPDEALAYLVARLPATFSANMRVLELVKDLVPDFAPSSVLDVGAGPATASFAASQMWDFQNLTLVEPNPHLRDVGTKFITPEIDADISWVSSGLEKSLPEGGFDLVLASYVLNELNSSHWSDAIRNLWARCSGTLVIIETGTPLGFSVIERVRSLLPRLDGAYLTGPCPQDGVCPLSQEENRWCHFSVRVERSKMHKSLKSGSTLGYEDEKFSWIALSRTPVKRPSRRIIGHPSVTRVASLQVCTQDGLANTMEIAKSSPLYKMAKKLEWGDGFDHE